MRVLHIIDHFAYGGAERLLATMNGVADEFDLQLTAASLAPPTSDRTGSLALLEQAGLQPSFIGVRRLSDPRALRKLRQAITASGCHVVHAHLGYSAALVPLAARQLGVPCVSTLHHVPNGAGRGGREWLKEWIWTRSAERGSALVYVSQAARAAAARHFGPSRPSWRVVHNGVDLSAFRPTGGVVGSPPADLRLPSGVPIVTVVAALREPKGHEFALRAWPVVRAAVPGAILLIVGDGPHRPVLERIADEGVVFAGAREDVPQILRASTLALLPSLTEALPTALIEAAACGLPAVATDVGGTPETVLHGRSGLLVPPGDAPAVGAAVIELLLDQERRKQYADAARKLAEERFDHRAWVRSLADLYRTVSTGDRHDVNMPIAERGQHR